MSFGDWFRYYCLGSIFFWWVALIVVTTVSYPFVRGFRRWQSRRRFVASQSARLANPQNADVRFQLATLFAEGGNWRRAAGHAREAVRVAAENPLYDGQVPHHFLILLGQALYRLGLHDESVEAFQRALSAKAERGSADARFGLGKALYRKGDAAGAVDAYRRSIGENPSNLEAYFRLAQAAAALGRDSDVGGAREEFHRVAASLPRFAGRGSSRWRLAFLLFPIARRLG